MAIVKILARHNPSYRSLIGYQLRYMMDGAKTDLSHIFTQNLRADTIDGLVQEFIENEAFRRQSRSDQVYLFHEILSFNSSEQPEAFNPEVIGDLVKTYMQLRGETGVILGAVHRDKDHVHVHFCVSALHFRTGRSFGLSKIRLQELKVSFQAYHRERYPLIEKSFPMHGKGKAYVRHTQWHAKQKEEIIATIQQCFVQATTQKQFLELLRDKELHHYERSGKPAGVEYEGIKFRFSRLLENGGIETLPVEQTEEDRVIEEIRLNREQRNSRDNRERDMEDRAR